jgi:hypothetical protein
MHNYPVNVIEVEGGFECVSPVKINAPRKKYRLSLSNEKIKDGIYHYDAHNIDMNYCSTKAGSIAYASLYFSKLAFPESLDWIKWPEDNLSTKILEKSKNLISPNQFKLIVEHIIDSVPDEKYVEYIEDKLIYGGISSIIEFNTQLECMSIERYRSGLFTSKEIINKYNFDDVDKYAYHSDSLIEKFLIRTDGFNQCFKYKDEYYSSVVIKQRDWEKPYHIYIYGCDDSSYTKYVDTLEEAQKEVDILIRLSEVINRQHIHALKYEFTN